METPVVISADKLTKRYAELVAVDEITFTIHSGECFGFLGPNGAGKTSIMKMITCVSPVTSGELWVDGKNVDREKRAIKSQLGVVSQADSLDPDLSVLQNLLAYGRFYGLRSDKARERAWAALDMFQLRDKAYQEPDELSGGMRRRLLIGRALLHEPKILVLDEPTTGLDPQTRLLVWDRLITLRRQGITILLTTHYMEEAAYLCDRLVIMDLGRILVEGSPDELVQEHAAAEVVQIRVPEAERRELAEKLRGKGVEVEETGDGVMLFGEDGRLAQVESVLDGMQVTRRPGNLEDVFLRLTGRVLRDQ
ncbi:MAG: ABC transporter ATP-binding protein [Chloroflexi bacterium]|nr:ABC transporter ATP-binding protein [Chloroflexota bacterium]